MTAFGFLTSRHVFSTVLVLGPQATYNYFLWIIVRMKKTTAKKNGKRSRDLLLVSQQPRQLSYSDDHCIMPTKMQRAPTRENARIHEIAI